MRQIYYAYSLIMTKFLHQSGRIVAVTVFMMALLICVLIAFIFRDDMFQSLQDPGQPFQTYEEPKAPNYAKAESWMVRPDLRRDPYEADTMGDVFVIVPSVYLGGEHWNLPVDDDRRRNKLERIVRPNYVAPYGKAGRLFAPYYRQGSLYTFMNNREDSRKARDLAYSDVRRAFEFFLQHSPPERPIILAGHGQGGSHLQRLLADYFQGDLVNRLAAAYVIDDPLPLDKFESELSNLKPCETDIDTSCIVAFGAFMPRDNMLATRFVKKALVSSRTGFESVEGRTLLCTNPILWNLSEDYAPRRLHLGGVAAEGIDPETVPAPLPKQTGAECQDGILLVDRPKSRSLRRPIKFGGKFRTLPSNLFYEDLRHNAQRRVETLITEGGLPTRVKKLDELEIIDIVDSPVTPIDYIKKN